MAEQSVGFDLIGQAKSKQPITRSEATQFMSRLFAQLDDANVNAEKSEMQVELLQSEVSYIRKKISVINHRL